MFEELLKNWTNIYKQLDFEECDLQNNVEFKSIVFLDEFIKNTSGIILDNWWLRILWWWKLNGKNRNILNWNKENKEKYLLVADDIIGWFFAINQWYFDWKYWDIYYLAPDSLNWECLKIDYLWFIKWAINWDLDLFYKNNRWQNRQELAKDTNINNWISIYPFLFMGKELDINKRSKKIISINEMWNLTLELQKQILE